MQPDMPQDQQEPSQETLPEQPVAAVETAPKKRANRSTILGVIGVVLLSLLLIAVVGLGVLAYNLNTNLTAIQGQLAALQDEHAQLQSDYTSLQSDDAGLKSDIEKLTADLNQSKADLETTSGNLASTQTDLKKSQDQSKAFQTQVTKAQLKVEILNALMNPTEATDLFAIDSMVKATNDQQLVTEWNTMVRLGTPAAVQKFLQLLVGSIVSELS